MGPRWNNSTPCGVGKDTEPESDPGPGPSCQAAGNTGAKHMLACTWAWGWVASGPWGFCRVKPGLQSINYKEEERGSLWIKRDSKNISDLKQTGRLT